MFLFNHGKFFFDLVIFEGTCESIAPNSFSLKYVHKVSTFSLDFSVAPHFVIFGYKFSFFHPSCLLQIYKFSMVY